MAHGLQRQPIESEIPIKENDKAGADITFFRSKEGRQKLTLKMLELLNRSGEMTDIIRDVLISIKESTGFEAVGLRLRDGEDFPYYETSGFPANFVESERYLCARDRTGAFVRDSEGNPYLECMCGNIICGRTDPCLPFFTKGGSFWTNSTTALLAATTEEDRKTRTRNRCNGEGYESVALIPLRATGEIIGLLQLNDRRAGMFTLEMIKFFEEIGPGIGIAFMRKEAEENLHESEEKYRSMMEAMSDPVYICSSDYRIAYMNPAMIKRTGRDAEGELCHKVIHEGDEKCSWCVHDKIQRGERCEMEVVSPKDDRFFHISHSPIFHADGAISKMTIFRDITDLKRKEAALKESEKRHRFLTENVSDGVCIVQDGKFQFVNPALSSILGYSADQLIDMDPIALFHGNHKQRWKKLMESLEKGIRAKYIQAICIRRGGQEIWVEECHNIIKWEDRPALHLTVRDITESKHRELALEAERIRTEEENRNLRLSAKDRYRFGDIIGKSPPMQEVYELILKAGNTDASVIVFGESGTGKELVAQAIHNASKRRDSALVTVNCGAIPESLVESEFFGYLKGAFTGAVKDKLGFLDVACGGTLFLDEIGDLDLNNQVKLLRAIEEGSYIPVGGNKIKTANIRIVSATNRNLNEQVRRGVMREDFFYRIHVIPIHMPSLRARMEDIPLLIEHFTKSYCNEKKRRHIPANVMDALYNYHWPGNIRELQNILHRYLAIGRLDLEDSGSEPEDPTDSCLKERRMENSNLSDTVEHFERQIINNALENTHWHREKAASNLGITRNTLFRKMKKLGLNVI